MKRVLVLGLGWVGRALYEIIIECKRFKVYGYDVDASRTVHRLSEIPRPINVLHICYPYRGKDDFIESTVNYIRMFSPDIVIVNSTVVPGTIFEVYRRTGVDIVHVPVRGVHKRMKCHLRFWTLFVGPINVRASLKAKEYLESLGFRVKIVKSPLETELAKLFETVYRALMITFWQEMHRVAKKFGADISVIAEFIADTHRVLGDRPIYYPDVIKGSCLIPNTILLKECYPESKFLEAILESNKLREKEVKDPEIKKDIGKVKKLWEQHIPKWYYE